jgi:hypothetical protein
MPRLLVHLDNDGYIDGTSRASGYDNEQATDGWHDVDPETDLSDALNRSFNPDTGVIGAKRQAAPIRVLSLRGFLQRCTVAERVAFNAMRAADPIAEVLWAELLADATVNLDDDALVNGLAMVKAANAAGGHQLWADDATADARIAAIRA